MKLAEEFLKINSHLEALPRLVEKKQKQNKKQSHSFPFDHDLVTETVAPPGPLS